MRVGISRSLLGRIMALAQADPYEICGLLLGEEGVIRDIRPAANIAADPARHFELDPAVLIAAHRGARKGGPAILGHYHSHPSGRAEPSATDAASAAPDGSLWLILGGGAARLWSAGPDGQGGVAFTAISLDIM
ncbi:MAG TPA: M67 family metallopeptidase [Sphingobium sp.]|nr:M67 family metallopeptidase [Sphingobium sp.]